MYRARHRIGRYSRQRYGLMGVLLVIGILVTMLASAVLAEKPTSFDKNGRAVGVVGTPGFNEWGYNYQAHLFNGGYCDAYKNADWCQPYRDVGLVMKWNDAWLSNQDRSGDGNLDRHHGFDTYVGSGAWLTNHQAGEYEVDGRVCRWTYFTKIVAAPADATLTSGIWYTAEGVEIGPAIWGEFATIQVVENDSCAGVGGVQYLSPHNAGFGTYGPQN